MKRWRKQRRRLYVYILLCADGSFYVGVTNNPLIRLTQHNDGKNPTAYTFSRRPCRMVYCETGHPTFLASIAREKQLKRWTHAKKQALIDGDIKRLEELAACRNGSHYKFSPTSASLSGTGCDE